MPILVAVDRDTEADVELLADQARSVAVELGIDLLLENHCVAEQMPAILSDHAGPAVAVTGDSAVIDAAGEQVICYDLRIAGAVRGPRHLHGRGVWGLQWAIRHAVYRSRSPARRYAYGDDRDQWMEERGNGAGVDPDTTVDGVGPVGVLVHGGFWRSQWGADLMDALAIDLVGRGWSSYNLEYRRPDRHGWAATVADVASGIAAVERRSPGRPLVLFGHSAGGQLVLQAAADRPVAALVVSLAGVVDLREGHRRGLGEGAITMALGGSPEDRPNAYRAADPFARLPLATPTLLVQGLRDSPDLVDFNRRFARASGARLIEDVADHFDVIAPTSQIWSDTVAAVEHSLGRAGR